MKKALILTAYFSTLVTHSMENSDQEKINHFSIVLYGTTINVSRTSLHDIADKANILIVGKHEQQLLTDTVFDTFYQTGTIDFRKNILCKHQDDESASDDETHKPFQEENRSKLWEKTIDKCTSSKIIGVTEPCILLDGWANDYEANKQIQILCYNTERFNAENNYQDLWSFYEDYAILEASKDLVQCYEEVLTLCLPIDEAESGTKKNIAIPTLSADVGFPRDKAALIALTTITNFIQNNPNTLNNNAYNCIELFVKKRSEFETYTTFLRNYRERPTILLLTHKDTDHFLYNIPREIIDNILKLLHTEIDYATKKDFECRTTL